MVGLAILLVAVFGVSFVRSRSQTASVGSTAETAHVRIAYLPVLQGLPVYLAQEKGYSKSAGFDVELVKFEAPNQIIDALLSGQIDMTAPSAAMGIAGVASFKNPGKLQIYAASGGDMQIQNDAIMVQASSTMRMLADLHGKKFGILAGSIQWRTIAREILSQNNLDPKKDVTLVELPLGLQVQALAQGQVDAVLALEPIATLMKGKGIGRTLAPNAGATYVANPLYAGAGILRTEFAQQNPKTAEKILSIISRAMQEIATDPTSARQYLKGYTPLTDDLIAAVPLPRFVMYDHMTAADKVAVQKFYDIFTKWGVVSGNIDFHSLLYAPQ